MDFRCRRRFRIFIGFPGEANFSMLPSYGFSAENLRRLDFRYRIVTVRTDDHRLMFIRPFLKMFLIIQEISTLLTSVLRKDHLSTSKRIMTSPISNELPA
jgi:hypothetical protein